MPENKQKLKSINPATEEEFGEYDLITDEELEEKIKTAEKAFWELKSWSMEERAKCMYKVADLLETNKEKYGKMITMEIGRPIAQSISEPEKCAKFCRWNAENVGKILQEKHLKTESGKKTCVVYEPKGVLFQISPFNYPFMQCIRFLAASVMAGNTALIRHSHNTTRCAMFIEEMFKEAGFPVGTVQILLISHDQASKVMEDRRIKGITITGSVKAGKSVAEQAGRELKKSVMELGGADTYIVCNDADLETAVKQAVKGRIVNNGESCTAAKRFIVLDGIYDKFLEQFAQKMKDVKMGDPMNKDYDLGPLARKDLREAVQKSVDDAVKDGAKLLCGGKIPEGRGYYYPATVLADVTPENCVFNEEIFGPVAMVIKASDEKEAVDIHNTKSIFGLGGGVFTKDETKGERIARQLDCGLAFVNRIVTSDPSYEFSGRKDSGYGTECGVQGIMEWVNTKSLIIA